MILLQETVDHLFAHAEREAPIEACGYLAGNGDLVVKHFPMTNVDNSTEHFSFDPAEQFAILKKARNEGFTITGVYHSHPASPARPSKEDVQLAFDPSLVYIIISLLNERTTIKGYRIRKGTVEEEPLIISGERV